MLLQKALNVSLARQSLADRFDPFLEIRYDNSDQWCSPCYTTAHHIIESDNSTVGLVVICTWILVMGYRWKR